MHSWLGIKNNLAIATFYCAVLGGIGSFITYFYPTASDKIPYNSNTLSDNTFNNSPVKIEQNIYIGYSPEQYRKNLNEDLESKKKDYDRANVAEKPSISLQISAIQEKLLNLPKSYPDALAEIQKLSLALKESESKNPKIASQQFIEAQAALKKGDYSKADAVFKDIENAAEPSIANAANAAFQRARIANNSFRWNDALELAKKAQSLQPKNEMYLSFYADMLLNTGNKLQAQKLYEQSLQLTNEKYGASSIEAAYQHNRLALAYDANNFSKAEFHNLKAIEIARTPHKAVPIDNLLLGNLYSNLAKLYQENDKYSEAESNHLIAISIHEKALPANLHDLSIDYNNLGGLYALQHKFNQAETYFLKAITIDEKFLPIGHPSLPMHYDNLAQIYIDKGSKPKDKPTLLKAKVLLLKAITLLEKYPPPVESNIASTYYNLGFTYFLMQDYKAAEHYFEKATNITFKNFGINDYRTSMALKGYIDCLKMQHKNISPALKKYGVGVRPSNG